MIKKLDKKNSIITVIILLIAIVLSIGLLTRPKVFGSMNHIYTTPTTNTSNISFRGESGDKIKFSFSSHIEQGNLDILLYDSKGNAVYELDKAKELETYFTLEHSDTYILSAEYSDFIGNFKVRLAKAKTQSR